MNLKIKDIEINKINENNIVKEFDPSNNLLIINLKDIKGNDNEIKLDFR